MAVASVIVASVATLGAIWSSRNIIHPATLTRSDLILWYIPVPPSPVLMGTQRRIYSNWNSKNERKGCRVVAETSYTRHSGRIIFHQSYWGEPEELPLEMREIQVSGDEWRFALVASGFSGTYEIRMFNDHALLRRVDVKSGWVRLAARNGAMDDPVKVPDPTRRPFQGNTSGKAE